MATKDKTQSKLNSESEFQGKIKGMFYLLQTNIEKFLEELDQSYELYKIGEKTEIAKKLEEIASAHIPGKMETELIGKLLKTLNIIGKKVVVDGFIKNSKNIANAYLLSENESRILYGIVPKPNKEQEVRDSINFFYSETSHWEMFRYTEPLFQVIPNDLIEKVKYQTTIK